MFRRSLVAPLLGYGFALALVAPVPQSSAQVCFILDGGLCASACSGDREDSLRKIEKADDNDRVCALALAETAELQQLLIDHGVDPSTKTNTSYRNSPAGRTALYRVIFKGRQDLFDNLLKNHVDVKSADRHGQTALMLAAASGEPKMVQGLLDAGADVNARDRFGETALGLAKSYLIVPNRDEVVAILEKAGGTR